MLNTNDYNSRLKELENNDISKVDFETDIQGKPVLNINGTEIGTISGLLYDVQSTKVRYAIVDLQLQARRVLAPIGTVNVTTGGTVEIPQLTEALIDHLPDYIKDQVNPGVENIIRLAYAESSSEQDNTSLTGHPEVIDSEAFYSHKLFHTSHLFNFLRSNDVAKTVKAVFDDGLEAESAITELLAAGFNTDDVELSSTAANQVLIQEEIETPQISNGGSVISIKINNSSDAEKASEILSKNGSVTIFEQGAE